MQKRYVHSPRYEIDIGPHVFPVAKYRLLVEHLLAAGLARPEELAEPEMPTREMLERAHGGEYLDDLEALRLTAGTASSELPLTREIVDGFTLAAGGTLLAARLALENRACLHVGGGLHHAFADRAEGFCYVNDVAVAAGELLHRGAVERVLVVDLDVHQGNGTAHIFQDRPRVFTFSMHQENNYPIKQRSDRDVGLPDGVGDAEYLQILASLLPGIIAAHRPDLVFYLAGADPYRGDQLGGLALSLEGLAARDRCVFACCAEARIPVAVTLAGGYAFETADTIAIHAGTCREMLARFFDSGKASEPTC